MTAARLRLKPCAVLLISLLASGGCGRRPVQLLPACCGGKQLPVRHLLTSVSAVAAQCHVLQLMAHKSFATGEAGTGRLQRLVLHRVVLQLSLLGETSLKAFLSSSNRQ